VGRTAILKKSLLVGLFLGLVFVELVIPEAFLPYEWQRAITQQAERIFPSH
jgi:hypothetical protein